MSYTIKRVRGNVPKALRVKFTSYDAARNAIRRWIRSHKIWEAVGKQYVRSNASIADFGFSVKGIKNGNNS